jgi:hypothetical protein
VVPVEAMIPENMVLDEVILRRDCDACKAGLKNVVPLVARPKMENMECEIAMWD